MEGPEDFENLVVVVHIQCPHEDFDVGVSGLELSFEGVEAVGAAGAEGEVAAHAGVFAGHALAQARACAGDKDILAGDGHWGGNCSCEDES